MDLIGMGLIACVVVRQKIGLAKENVAAAGK